MLSRSAASGMSLKAALFLLSQTVLFSISALAQNGTNSSLQYLAGPGYNRTASGSISRQGSMNAAQATNISCDSASGSPPWAAENVWQDVNADQALDTFLDWFANDKLYCTECPGLTKSDCNSSDPACDTGLRNLTGGRFDLSLWQYLFATDSVKCGYDATGCTPPTCDDSDNVASVWALGSSLGRLSNLIQTQYSAFGDAGTAALGHAQAFSDVFAPLPNSTNDDGETYAVGVVSNLINGLAGFIPGIALFDIALLPLKEVVKTITGVSGGLATNAVSLSKDKNVPVDLTWVFTSIMNNLQQALEQTSDSLLGNGTLDYGSTHVTLDQMMRNGSLLNLPVINTTDASIADGQAPALALMYQQVAWVTWQFLEVGDYQTSPFITFANGTACEDLDMGDKSKVPLPVQQKSQDDAMVTINGTCYWLLTAYPEERTADHRADLNCTEIQPLPGGTNSSLTNNAWTGLLLEDFIVPSVLGWEQNDRVNGFPISLVSNSSIEFDYRAPGFLNVSVCDYVGARDGLIGINCPRVGDYADESRTKCQTEAPNAVPDASGVYQPGSCHLHLQQFARNDNAELNPYTQQYQLLVDVSDDSNRPIGGAAKEWVGAVINVWNTPLPWDILIHVEDKDDQPMEIWYGEDYWTTNFDADPHYCTTGGWDEGGNRQIDCTFLCPEEADGTPPGPSATIGHQLPTGAVVQSAIDFGGALLNTYPVDHPAATHTPPPGDYERGNCYIHVTQYGMQNDANKDTASRYQLQAYLGKCDTCDSLGGYGPMFAQDANGQIPAPPDQPQPVFGLRGAFNMTPTADEGRMEFAYASAGGIVTWTTDDQKSPHYCSASAWSGTDVREIYCQFHCD